MAERLQGWTPNPNYNGWGDFDRVRNAIAEALSHGSRLLGSQFTITDIYLPADLRIAQPGELIAQSLQRLSGYVERIERRPAFVRALEIDSRDAARFDRAQIELLPAAAQGGELQVRSVAL